MITLRRYQDEAVNAIEKQCTKCGLVKPETEFYINRARRDGRDTRCKACVYSRHPRPRSLDGFKSCCDCKRLKPVGDFSKDRTNKSGLADRCKDCASVRMRQYRADGRMADAKKRYRQTQNGREKERAWRRSEAGKSSNRETKRKYRESGRARETNRAYMLRTADKYQARRAVRNAVRRGELPEVKTLLCRCGKRAEQYHHCEGYDRNHWLDVVPVCLDCHVGRHYGTGQEISDRSRAVDLA